ncbi:hypothetical protein EG327_002032 [Venturia inaequalis]|uniref:BAP29/BAP31 transmembrane domain-containing protein n=1 Tax=Venturia inaequalis TaxID=5025 RepID=A0A8H3VT35_VENIN|nr:hypothetical protein EG327_002032 [Venturia inaequalis]
MNFLNVLAYIFLILELTYLSILILACKIPYFRDTKRSLAKSITASRLATWVRLITTLVMIVLAIHFSISLWTVASLTPFERDVSGKKYDAQRAKKFLEERNMYLSGFVLVLHVVIRTASFERVVVEEPEELDGGVLAEPKQQEGVEMAQVSMPDICVRRIARKHGINEPLKIATDHL